MAMKLNLAPGRQRQDVVLESSAVRIQQGRAVVRLSDDEALRVCDAIVDALERRP